MKLRVQRSGGNPVNKSSFAGAWTDDPCACEAGTCLCAGMLACSEDAAADVGMLRVLFKQRLVSVRAWRAGGKEVAACLHCWIVCGMCPPLSEKLMYFCSNIHKCGHDPHWCWRSHLSLHAASLCLNVSVNNGGTDSAFLPAAGVCCFNLEAWMVDKKVLQDSVHYTRDGEDLQTNRHRSCRGLVQEGARRRRTAELSGWL